MMTAGDNWRNKPDTYWREKLTPEQYEVVRNHGTERPYTGPYLNHKADGTYTCIGCDAPLFSSDTKFESGTGWPSFWDEVEKGAIEEKSDVSYGMRRVEVLCNRCGGHLGHVFEDGPRPTGLRYCINSLSLNFQSQNTD